MLDLRPHGRFLIGCHVIVALPFYKRALIFHLAIYTHSLEFTLLSIEGSEIDGCEADFCKFFEAECTQISIVDILSALSWRCFMINSSEKTNKKLLKVV